MAGYKIDGAIPFLVDDDGKLLGYIDRLDRERHIDGSAFNRASPDPIAAISERLSSPAAKLKAAFAAQGAVTSKMAVSADVPTVTMEGAQVQPSAWASPLSSYRFIKLQVAGVKTSQISFPSNTVIGMTGAFNDGQSFDFLKSNFVGGSNGAIPISFQTDAQVFGFAVGGGWAGNIFVNGKPASVTGYTFAGAGSSRYWVRVAFSTKQPRNIVVVSEPSYGIGGVVLGNTDSIGSLALSELTWAHEGDSYSQSRSSFQLYAGIVSQAAAALGITAFSSGPVGGSGYQARNSLSNAIERIGNVTSAFDGGPKIISVALGLNDQALSGNAAYTTAYFAALRAACPDALFVVMDPFCPVETNGAAYMTSIGTPITNAVKAAGGDYVLIHNIAGTWETSWGISGSTGGTPWQTGTGRTGTPSGTGNGDIYTDAGGTHVITAGIDYLADRFYSALRAAVLSL